MRKLASRLPRPGDEPATGRETHSGDCAGGFQPAFWTSAIPATRRCTIRRTCVGFFRRSLCPILRGAERSTAVDKNRQGREFMKSGFGRLGGWVSDRQKGVARPPLEKPRTEGARIIDLPPPDAGAFRQADLYEAIRRRRSRREFADEALTPAELSILLWATQGVRRVVDDYVTIRPPSYPAPAPIPSYAPSPPPKAPGAVGALVLWNRRRCRVLHGTCSGHRCPPPVTKSKEADRRQSRVVRLLVGVPEKIGDTWGC